MTPLAIILVSVAGFNHALWNLMGKRQNPSGAFFLVASLAGVVCLLPLVIANRQVVAAIPASVWVLIVLSGIFETLYYVSLGGAYRNGDMSVAYPLARALPAIMMMAISIAFGIGKPLTPLGVVGIVAVVIGCLIVPMRSFGEIRLSNYLNVCCALALLAAVGTTGYTLIDNEALRQLRSLPELGLGNAMIALLYLALTTISIICFLTPFVIVYRPERGRLGQIVRSNPAYALLAGLMIAGGYSLVLAAMAYTSNISYLGAFRQLSIPLGAMLGIVVQKEPLYTPKAIGIAIVLSGLVLIAVV